MCLFSIQTFEFIEHVTKRVNGLLLTDYLYKWQKLILSLKVIGYEICLPLVVKCYIVFELKLCLKGMKSYEMYSIFEKLKMKR